MTPPYRVSPSAQRLIKAFNRRYHLLRDLRASLETIDSLKEEPLVEYLQEAEVVFEKIIFRMCVLSAQKHLPRGRKRVITRGSGDTSD